MAQVLQPQIKNLLERMPKGLLERAKELARIEGETFIRKGSMRGLHYLKLGTDEMIEAARETGLGKFSKKALVQFKDDLLTVLDDLSPTYKAARETHAALSKPIGQAQVSEYLLEKMRPALSEYGALGRETGAQYAQALRGAEQTVERATGFAQPLEKVMGPQKMAQLTAVAQDLARKASAQELGRGVGSNTYQNLAMRHLLGSGRKSLAPNLLWRPSMITNFFARQVYGHADDEIRKRVAKALLTPEGTLELIRKAEPSKRGALVEALRYVTTPLGVTGAPLLNAP